MSEEDDMKERREQFAREGEALKAGRGPTSLCTICELSLEMHGEWWAEPSPARCIKALAAELRKVKGAVYSCASPNNGLPWWGPGR